MCSLWVAVCFLGAVAAVSELPRAVGETLSDGAAGEGRRLAQRLCSGCHDIDPGGSTPRAGPPFAELARQARYSVPWFRGWLANPHLGTPIESLSQSEIDRLAAYYETLAVPKPGRNSGAGPLDFEDSDRGAGEFEGTDIETDASERKNPDLDDFGADLSTGDDFSDFDLEAPLEDGENAPDPRPQWPPSPREGR